MLVKDGEDIRQNKLFREVFAMISLHHPHIVRHHTTWTEEPPINFNAGQPIGKSQNNRKLTHKKKAQETVAEISEDHINISGVEWEVSNKENAEDDESQQNHESEVSSNNEDTSYSQIKMISNDQQVFYLQKHR